MPTPPIRRAPGVVVVTPGTVTVVLAVEDPPNVETAESNGVVVFTPLYAVITAFHFCAEDSVHVQDAGSEAALETTW
jgi:hypothetical protein